LGGQAATGRTPALAAQQTLGQLPGVSLRPPPAPAASTAAVATTGSPPASATESAATEATALTATAAQTDADEAAADTAAAQLPAVTADAATEPTATAMAEPASADATAAAPAVPVATTDDTTATATTSDAAATTEATTQQAASQTAALPPSARQERLLFAAETAALPEGVEPLLDAIISRMAADETLRLQILAYAAGTAETSSQARRLSLSRALAVRKYLIDNGIGGTRMDVRALGNRAEDGPADRVDLMLVAG
ncbi:MAG: OmpA family protein, partial [Alphaproteobacteria bacterium]